MVFLGLTFGLAILAASGARAAREDFTYLVAEQGTVCTGPLDATIEQLWPLINDMCYNVTGGMHQPLPHAIPELNAWYQAGGMNGLTATVIAIDGDAKWETCLSSFKTILDDCAKDGRAAFGMRRYGNELYIIDNGVPDVPQLTGHGV
jgi:hypothetical protein